ncbi:MAG: hypothetical protein LAT68_01965 [Cyclobacteriaceae bacterium]|nr:hypothetical protein [Cyclobacteriaceae bacterium]MCH8515069.1 hypothetical protein [Cyclobacteriaceae bacterium]
MRLPFFLLTAALIFMSICGLHAQDQELIVPVVVDRLELEFERGDEFPMVIPVNNQGVLIYQEDENFGGGRKEVYTFQFFDAYFDKIWETTLGKDKNLSLITYDVKGENIFLIFSESGFLTQKVVLIELDLFTGKYEIDEFDDFVPMKINSADFIGESILFTGELNQRSVVLLYDQLSQNVSVVPGFYRSDSKITDVFLDRNNNVFGITTVDKVNRAESLIRGALFDEYGGNLSRYTLENDQENSFNFLQAKTLFDVQSGRHQVFCTYGYKRSDRARGWVTAIIYDFDNKTTTPKYINFGKMQNVFAYLKPRMRDRKLNRLQRRFERGRKVKLDRNIQLEGIIPASEETLVLAQAYFPRYSYNQFGFGGVFFLGYQYNNYTVASFNPEGSLLWDHTIRLTNVMTNELVNIVSFGSTYNGYVLSYKTDNLIRYTVFNEDGLIQQEQKEKTVTLLENDKIVFTDRRFGDFMNWYDEYHLEYGIQRIRNKVNPEVNRNRSVIYFNKIMFDLPPMESK